MKKYIISLIIVIAFAVSYLITNQYGFNKPEAELTLKRAAKAAIGTQDDPNARFRYEDMRLRNPETGKIPEIIREKELAYASTLPVRGSESL